MEGEGKRERQDRAQRTVLSPSHASPVFESKPVPSSSQVSTYSRFDAFTGDDDLVYPGPNSEPVLLSLFPKFNTRPFLFEGCASRAPATILIDSGASTSFVPCIGVSSTTLIQCLFIFRMVD
jgi:hypothetical protein